MRVRLITILHSKHEFINPTKQYKGLNGTYWIYCQDLDDTKSETSEVNHNGDVQNIRGKMLKKNYIAFLLCLVVFSNKVFSQIVPNQIQILPEYPNAEELCKLFNTVSEALNYKMAVNLTSSFDHLQNHVKSDLKKYGNCKKVFMYVYTNMNQLSEVYLVNAPTDQDIILEDVKIHYNTSTDLTFIYKSDLTLISKEFDIDPTSCGIGPENRLKYEGICENSSNRLIQLNNLIWSAFSSGSAVYADSTFNSLLKQFSSNNYDIQSIKTDVEWCERKEEDLQVKFDVLNSQGNRLTDEKVTTEKLLIDEKEKNKRLNESLKRKIEERKRTESEWMWGYYFISPCQCPELHHTSYHKEGYSCEDWKQPIPCEDDFECQEKLALEKIDKEIETLKEQIKTSNEKKSKLSKKFDNIEAKIIENQNEKIAVNQELKNSDCASKRDSLLRLTPKRAADSLNIIHRCQQIRQISMEFSVKKYHFEKLHLKELSIYNALAENNGTLAQKHYQEYVTMLEDLRKYPAFYDVFKIATFPDPLTLWNSFK